MADRQEWLKTIRNRGWGSIKKFWERVVRHFSKAADEIGLVDDLQMCGRKDWIIATAGGADVTAREESDRRRRRPVRGTEAREAYV